MRHEPFEQLPLVEKLLKRKEELEQARKRSSISPAQQSAANPNRQRDDATEDETEQATISV